ncbi:hypothetical protein TRFO_36130 [Tritrichomonas foetus]|uniref:Protein kinase domain-containing protein n=1 Tax=Tritrichomonas foetus TaxID=1144522 RepID=A0A1J4JEL0_9EUKA|nr:hypothetical protein TRFO_36130 [Tritrichomonas foetus]|eukprot:OHS97594.1 hypothetical protein TRFO_36130 [Tritrichomonas foetus]
MTGTNILGYKITEILSSSNDSVIASTSNNYILKLVDHNTTESKSYQKVMKMLKRINSENIIQPIDTFRISNYDGTVTHKADCDLYDLLEDANYKRSHGLRLNIALKIMHDAILAVSEIHHNRILHGDIKLENFLVYFPKDCDSKVKPCVNCGRSNKNKHRRSHSCVLISVSSVDSKCHSSPSQRKNDANLRIVLNDFDTACVLEKEDEVCFSNLGTEGYASPEFLNGHSLPSDIYALGVTLSYVWAFARKRNADPTIIAMIDTLLQRMVSVDPKERPTAEKCLQSFSILSSRIYPNNSNPASLQMMNRINNIYSSNNCLIVNQIRYLTHINQVKTLNNIIHIQRATSKPVQLV